MTRVLIVEDDVWFREHVADVLTRHDYDVHQSAHALDAIHQIDALKPDVVLLDMMLPGANGVALLHELHSHSDLAEIPIVVMSTKTDLSMKDLAAYGVKVILDKSTMRFEDIVAAIRKATYGG